MAGDRCVRYFSPALLPNGAGSCGTVTLCPPGGRRAEGLSLVGLPVLPSWWGHLTALQAQRTPCSWQMRVEVDSAAALCPLAIRGRKVSAGPGSTTRVRRTFPTTVPVSGGGGTRRALLRASVLEDPGGQWLWSRVRHRAEAVGTADGTWHCRDEPFGGMWV